MVLGRGRGGDDKIGQKRTEHEPGSVFGMDEKGVFPLPTKTGHGGERLFHQGGGVDTDAVGSPPGNEGLLSKLS